VHVLDAVALVDNDVAPPEADSMNKFWPSFTGKNEKGAKYIKIWI
jgi:hypothetical protein